MPLRKVRFNNFKNLKGEFDLTDRINVIIGNNGQGKTNFLEGLYYLSYGTGFGASQEPNNIKWNSKNGFFSLSGLIEKPDDEVKIEIKYENTDANLGRKKFLVNDIARTRKNFMGNLSSLLFAPQSVDLVSGSPDGRRKAIDDILSLLSYEYAEALSKYRNIIRNRNKILHNLSNHIGHPRELTYWDEALIKEGSYIISERANFFEYKQEEIAAKAKALFNGEFKGLNIAYQTKFAGDIKKNFESKIEENQEKEIWAGSTLYGPHREDFEFNLGTISLRESGSRGQQRLASLIFILTVFDIFEDKEDTSAILLLDDIMSELDPIHRNNIEKMLLGKHIQVVITTAEKENFTKDFLKEANKILL